AIQCHCNRVRIAAHLTSPCGRDLSFEGGRSAVPVPLFVISNVVKRRCVTRVHTAVKSCRQGFPIRPTSVRLMASFTRHTACFRMPRVEEELFAKLDLVRCYGIVRRNSQFPSGPTSGVGAGGAAG